MNSITRYLLISLVLLASGSLWAATPTVTVTYFYTDLAGSVVAKTDAQGNVTWRKSYASYGATSERDEDNRRGFTGHAEDPNGLVYMRNRYYDPESGRFWATDAVGLDTNNPMTFNRYAYANNNPYKYVDPDGRKTTLVYSSGGIDHVAVHIDNPLGRPILYDPAGSYGSQAGENGMPIRSWGSDYFEGDDAQLEPYVKYQKTFSADKQSGVETIQIMTTPQEEAEIANNIEKKGVAIGGTCAINCSGVLRGVGPFKDMEKSYTPSGLRDEAKKIKNKQDENTK